MNFDNLRLYHEHYMCLIIFEEKAEIQDQYPLSLNRDRDRDHLQKYWAIMCRTFVKIFQNSIYLSIYSMLLTLTKSRQFSKHHSEHGKIFPLLYRNLKL